MTNKKISLLFVIIFLSLFFLIPLTASGGGEKKIEKVPASQLIKHDSVSSDIYRVNGQFVKKQYSGTTTSHIKEFLKQNGFKADNIKQILKDYKEDK